MKLTSCTKFYILFLLCPLESTLGVYYIPQQTEVTYVNEKYAYNGKAFIKRYGMKSPYYYNIEAGIKHTWGNNITLQMVFFESQKLNEYKRSSFEIYLKLCDLLEREPYYGKTFNIILAKRGISCPMKPGMYILHNLTLTSMPNMLSTQKGKIEATFRQLPTNDVITTVYVTFVIKEKYIV